MCNSDEGVRGLVGVMGDIRCYSYVVSEKDELEDDRWELDWCVVGGFVNRKVTVYGERVKCPYCKHAVHVLLSGVPFKFVLLANWWKILLAVAAAIAVFRRLV